MEKYTFLKEMIITNLILIVTFKRKKDILEM